MNIKSSQRLIYSVALGYVVILNIIGSSYLEFYPTNLLIGAAFAVGIAMVIGSVYFFLTLGRPKNVAIAVKVATPVRTVRMRRIAAPA
ncbi:MAG: hypothetical protein KKH41_00430 [Candidatus Thermoplasmatota archaeon]|nr:hypothetical protein [Euryarchaeota archaeon]MBU4032168.1 hypothetical protein [Candidatus Thermoplasmatota archaeon]MBU4071040.1 hypothetical protein [Candidatus Thermoplasmatota archaeon]MBU4145123.1 hypothetical protein [Candidatus Thermoplasmatota archaeon]MBU4591029.1 hypothetical protein [Candidatus Thermoplasmatota archaeon]